MFLNTLSVERLLEDESRIFRFIDGTGIIKPTVESAWPRAFKQRLDVMRRSKEFEQKVKTLEMQKWGFSIWDAHSAASSSVEVPKADKELENQINELEAIFSVLKV